MSWLLDKDIINNIIEENKDAIEEKLSSKYNELIQEIEPYNGSNIPYSLFFKYTKIISSSNNFRVAFMLPEYEVIHYEETDKRKCFRRIKLYKKIEFSLKYNGNDTFDIMATTVPDKYNIDEHVIIGFEFTKKERKITKFNIDGQSMTLRNKRLKRIQAKSLRLNLDEEITNEEFFNILESSYAYTKKLEEDLNTEQANEFFKTLVYSLQNKDSQAKKLVEDSLHNSQAYEYEKSFDAFHKTFREFNDRPSVHHVITYVDVIDDDIVVSNYSNRGYYVKAPIFVYDKETLKLKGLYAYTYNDSILEYIISYVPVSNVNFLSVSTTSWPSWLSAPEIKVHMTSKVFDIPSIKYFISNDKNTILYDSFRNAICPFSLELIRNAGINFNLDNYLSKLDRNAVYPLLLGSETKLYRLFPFSKEYVKYFIETNEFEECANLKFYKSAFDKSIPIVIASQILDLINNNTEPTTNYYRRSFDTAESLLENIDLISKLSGVRNHLTILNYLLRSHQTEFIPSLYATVQMMKDTYEFAKDLKIKLTEFPRYLTLEHNKLSFFHQKYLKDNKEELIKERSRKDLEFEKDKYKIIACSSSSELVQEGNVLGHCVGSYSNNIVNNKSSILFLRKADEPEKPYITIEVKVDKVTQIQGKYHNLTNYPEDVSLFIQEWKRRKALA